MAGLVGLAGVLLHAGSRSGLRVILILFRTEIIVKPVVMCRVILPEIEPIERIGQITARRRVGFGGDFGNALHDRFRGAS